MTKSDLLTLVSIVVTGCIGNKQPDCNINNATINVAEVHITYNLATSKN